MPLGEERIKLNIGGTFSFRHKWCDDLQAQALVDTCEYISSDLFISPQGQDESGLRTPIRSRLKDATGPDFESPVSVALDTASQVDVLAGRDPRNNKRARGKE